MPPVDPLDWAKHPRSPEALRFLVQAAKNDRVLYRILTQLVADKVCTADGVLLRRWDGARWVKH
ncbi:MAG: hypothetical protein AW12_00820 [Candidatus Accumulibacter sp. BA-94]|uniref:hypothetical protein n=1 Tax=Accumulibacter sp. TaxID=2053492 RepID=UPI00044E58ED|nr:hypothetical protein [Accumulibacter sp.]EXI92077.1 MAG: hypothetical protein AW12_00820 [Candidatus Accumulibacter sp. BA-94]HRD86768.1 hypothetical protein [Accumulibacter sp.]